MVVETKTGRIGIEFNGYFAIFVIFHDIAPQINAAVHFFLLHKSFGIIKLFDIRQTELVKKDFREVIQNKIHPGGIFRAAVRIDAFFFIVLVTQLVNLPVFIVDMHEQGLVGSLFVDIGNAPENARIVNIL